MVDLTRIELENFRPFFGKNNDINIGYSNKKLIIFEGETGEGKTSLNDAISWCLFGTYPSDKNDQEADFKLFNIDSLVRSKINEPITCRVTLTFEVMDEKNIKKKIVFSRSMQVIRKKELARTTTGVIHSRLEEFEFVEISIREYKNLTVLMWSGTQQIPDPGTPETIRETYFPSIVNDYYIIYGEQFIDPSNPERIKLAIERNCFSDIFDKIYNNLEDVRTEIIKENTSDKKKKEKLLELIADKDDTVSSIKEKKDELNNKLEEHVKITGSLTKIDREIGRAGGKQAKLLKEERINLESELNQLSKNIREMEKTVIGEGFSVLIQIMSQKSEKELLKEIENRVKKGEIPPNIKTEFIDALIAKKRCICKRDITSKEKKILEEMRDESVIGENYQEFLNLKFRLIDGDEKRPEKVKNYLDQLAEVEELKVTKNSSEERLQKISEELNSLHDVDKLERDRTKYSNYTQDIERGMDILRDEIKNLVFNLKGIEKDIHKIGEISDKEDKNTDKFIEELKNAIEKTKIDIIDSTRKEIEKFASELFKELFKHAAEVKRVELDSDYQVRVVLQKDKKEYVKTTFSTGEGLVFAISFLTALRKYSGYSGPIFLDSPFSVLDKKHRVNVSLNLPKTIPGQLIILTRPDTFDDIKMKLKPYINKLITLIREREWHTKINIT
tara:strand:+ start:6898 stop:8916 length:2019 start_codon:yes stop_codon:yes gene_type:complete